MALTPPFLPAPYNFDLVMFWSGVTAGGGPYMYDDHGVAPVDATTYATVTWFDARPMPTWAYVAPGGPGYLIYADIYNATTPTTRTEMETQLDAFAAVINAIPVAPARSQSVVSRSLNSAFLVSATRDSLVNYSISIAATLSLLAGQTGTASLQMSPTSGGTYVEVARFTNGNTGALTLGLNLTQALVNPLSAMIPAGYFVKIVSSGTATTTYVTGQETIL